MCKQNIVLNPEARLHKSRSSYCLLKEASESTFSPLYTIFLFCFFNPLPFYTQKQTLTRNAPDLS